MDPLAALESNLVLTPYLLRVFDYRALRTFQRRAVHCQALGECVCVVALDWEKYGPRSARSYQLVM